MVQMHQANYYDLCMKILNLLGDVNNNNSKNALHNYMNIEE